MEIGSLMAAVNGAAHTGMALVGLSRHEEGLEWFERGVALGREWEQIPRFTARTQNMWAGSLREIGDFTRSRELSEEALDGSTRAAFPGGQVSARIDLAVLDIEEGEVGRAERALPDLFAAAEGTKGWHQWLWMGRLAELEARAALLAGRADDAAMAAEEALKQALGPGRRKYATRARVVLGRALLALGRRAEAEAALEQAAQDARRLGHAPSLWQALAGRAEALISLGRDDEAQQTLAAARETVDGFARTLSDEHRERLLSMTAVASILKGP
jgi:tetratricopeptide (TPR) repeat protein